MAKEDQEVLGWEFDEYERYERGTAWYVVAGIVLMGTLILAFATRNFLFAVMIVMLVAVFYLRHVNHPRRLRCSIGEGSITVDGRRYLYEDIEEFAVIVPESGRPVLSINPAGLHLRMRVPMMDGVDPADVRALLMQHVQESDDQEESGGDVIGKILRL